MALRPLFCLFLSGHLRQVSLYAADVNSGGHYQDNKILGVGGGWFGGCKGNKLLTVRILITELSKSCGSNKYSRDINYHQWH